MFNWFLSTKKEKNVVIDTTSISENLDGSHEVDDSQESDGSQEVTFIPQAPTANYQIAQQIKRTVYDPVHYLHPEGLDNEIYSAFQNRMMRNILLQRDIDREEELTQIRAEQKVKKERKIREQQALKEQVVYTSFLIENAIKEMKMFAASQQYVEQISDVEEQISDVEEQISDVEEQISDVEEQISDVEEQISDVEEQISDVEKQELQEYHLQQDEQNEQNEHMKRLRSSSEQSEEIETIDWDTKLCEWGLDSSSAFINYNYLDDTNWNANPTFSYHNNDFLDNGPVNSCDLLEIVVDKCDNSFSVTIEDMNRISEELSVWDDKEEEEEEEVKEQNIMNEIDYKNKNGKKEMAQIVPEYPEGYLEINIGPMFSGKSTKSLFKLTSMADQRFRCLYVNSVKDVRKSESSDNMVSTHNSSYSKTSPKITCIKVANLSEVSVSNFDYIAVDELQFFDDAFDIILSWLNMGKYVIVASLDGDCYRRKFGCVLDLIPYSNEVTKLNAYCDICRDNYKILNRAPFTARMTSDTSAELVGGSDLYKAMCRKCHDFHLDVTVAHL
jgi:thymidine kinase